MKTLIYALAIIIATQTINAQFGGGNGTEAEPYQIKTRQHLELLADSVNTGNNWSSGKHFILMNNITEPVTTIIGFVSNGTFQGNFDGQNYTINLAIDMPESDYVGLFGLIHIATIKNIIVNGYGSISGQGHSSVGGIVGFLANTSISNCINNGSISGNEHIGGIVGLLANTSISNCINNGSISGNAYIGGIAGTGLNSSISNCINIGNITGKGHVGGIHGCGGADGSTINNCVNYGFVKGIDTGVGGINGHYYKSIRNSINTGVVEGENARITGPIQGDPDQ